MTETCWRCDRVYEANGNGCFCGELSETERLRAELARVKEERDHALGDIKTLGELGAKREALLTAARAKTAQWQTVTGFSEPELCQVHIRNVEGLEEAARAETARLRE